MGDGDAEDDNEDDGFTVVLEAVLEVVELGEIEVEEVELLLVDDNEVAELENIEDGEVESLFVDDSVVAELESIEDKRVPDALEEVIKVVEFEDIDDGMIAVVLEIVVEIVRLGEDREVLLVLIAVLGDPLLLLLVSIRLAVKMPPKDEYFSSGQPNACSIHLCIRVPLRTSVAFSARHAKAGKAPSTLSTMLSISSLGSQIAIWTGI